MIKRYITPAGILAYLLILLCAVTGVHAAQQPVTPITSGAGTTGLNLKQYNDTYINPRIVKLNDNDTDLYTNKADKSSFSSASAFTTAWGWSPGGGVTDYNDLINKPTIPTALSVLSDDSTHRLTTDAEKSTWNAKQSALVAGTDYLAPTGSAAGLTSFPAALATDTEVTAATSGKLSDASADGKAYGRKDSAWVEVLSSDAVVTFTASSPLSYSPTTGVLSLSMITDMVGTVSTDGSIPSSLAVKTYVDTSVASTGFSPTKTSSNPTAASTNGVYHNTTSGHWWYVDADGLSDITEGTYTTWDITPTAFGWGSITEAVVGDVYCYGTPYVVAGIDRTAVITATGSATYKINGGSATNVEGTVVVGDSVVPCLSVSTPGGTSTGNLIIGTVTGSPAYSLTAVSASTTFLNDTFTESAITLLTSHTPETGGSWVKYELQADQIFNVGASTGTVVNAGTSGDIAYNTVTPPSSDYTVAVTTGTTGSIATDRFWGACARMQSDKSGYCARLSAAGVLTIQEYASGSVSTTGTELATATYSIPTYTPFEIKFGVVGSTLTAELVGYGSISATDTTISSAGSAAILIRRNDNGGISSVSAQ